MRLALSATAATVLGWASLAGAADWTDAVFPVRAHDFGTVARGSKVRYSFKLVNSTDQDIHIESWRPKCGCTDVRVGARDIPPGTQTVIEASINTTNFTNYKASGLFLVIDKPNRAEVDLSLTCFIRPDLTLNPGGVDFGQANRSAEPKVELTLNYAGGQADWAVVGMKTISDHLVARLDELTRSPGGSVTYKLTATLRPSAPIGFFKDEITLKTNDPTSPTVPISVSAVVQSNVTVSPSVLNLGRVKPGETVKRTVLVRSAQPFRVSALKAAKPDLSADDSASDQPRAMHSANLTLRVPTQAGPYHVALEVETDLKGEPPAKLTIFATVAP